MEDHAEEKTTHRETYTDRAVTQWDLNMIQECVH